MGLGQLRYFVAIVEQGSFSRAASFLHVARPALSLHVRNMETALGTARPLRTPCGVVLAGAGKILPRHARIILNQLTVAEDKLRRYPNDRKGEVSLGVPRTIGQLPKVPLITSLNLSGHGHGLRELLNHHAKVAKLDLNTVIDVDSCGNIRFLVEEKLGYSVLPENAILSEDAENRQRSWAIIEPRIIRNIQQAHSANRPMTMLRPSFSRSRVKHCAIWRARTAGLALRSARMHNRRGQSDLGRAIHESDHRSRCHR